MEGGCDACLSTVAVVSGQPTGNITSIKRVATSGFYLNGEPFLAEFELGPPAQLTAGPITFGAPTPSSDGKAIICRRQPAAGSKWFAMTAKRNNSCPFSGGISAEELEVSPDGQWVTYTTYPESNLWRSKLDGSERLQLTFPPVNAHEPRWSPDGKQILFTDVPRRMFIVPADGGTLQQVMSKNRGRSTTEVGAGFWMPDANSIVFTMGSEGPYADLSAEFKDTRRFQNSRFRWDGWPLASHGMAAT